jgi:hypothetical protein
MLKVMCICGLLLLTLKQVMAAEDEVVEILITGESKDLYDVLPDRKSSSVSGLAKSLE